MQAQSTRTEVKAITSTQSLAAVQTLLRAGLGCITYLRDLLPEDNFTHNHLVAEEDLSLSYQGSDASFASADSKRSRSTNGFKIMVTMTRGYSDEADKIMNYLENGIFHALQKQYLKSFIFAIYLDSKDPNNIVEAYTFNFHYHTLPGTNVTVPIMTLGDGLQKMSLKDKKARAVDPVAEAARIGKAPTLLDVKKSVKSLLKTLIHATTQMDVLPKRRFATFKLFYTDETPADYEPPHFKAGDGEKDKWFFMTHDLDEIPDKWSIGKVDTGHHSVNLSVTSIATYLPSSTQHNNIAFLGTASRLPIPPSLTPVQEASLRAQQAENQARDAVERNIAWSVEESVELTDLDGEGEDDPDYVQLPDGSYEKIGARNPDLAVLAPAGVRNAVGEIEPLSDPMDVDEAHFSGVLEAVPTRLNELNIDEIVKKSNVEQTQDIGSFNQDPSDPAPTRSQDNSPSSSFTGGNVFDSGHPEGGWQSRLRMKHAFVKEAVDGGTTSGASLPFISTPFSRCYWFHRCMGYHSINDPRIPSEFICFDCRVRSDSSWELIKANLYPIMLSKFQELALFRRAIKIVETQKPQTSTAFAEANGGSNVLARQLFKRLETEGFITEQSTTLDDLGFPDTRSRSLKGGRKNKGKQPKNRKNVQKTTYQFNRSVLVTPEYSDYFNPDAKVEGRLLRLSELTSRVKSRTRILDHDLSTVSAILPPITSKRVNDETQTQEDTQMEYHAPRPARTNPDDESTPRPRKKIKISVTHGLDLAE
ncbi:Meiosis-specific protein HOP1 [Hypsizygus marmoreus]|uniref:Meiosis-specific protein HOP1 n=1 Tax=Hypsizygus marmoreus TaxID=39966 RepID=A0A369JG37_HYPMA|nr:Meiosis-specific protein HOP1 [Hypsizygus marmoreus]